MTISAALMLRAAFYVRSQAYIKLSLLENAIQDYKRALIVDPGQLAGLHKAYISEAHSLWGEGTRERPGASLGWH